MQKCSSTGFVALKLGSMSGVEFFASDSTGVNAKEKKMLNVKMYKIFIFMKKPSMF